MKSYDILNASIRTGVFVITLCVFMTVPNGSTAFAQGFEPGKVGVSGGISFQQAEDLGAAAGFERRLGYKVGVLYDQPIDAFAALPTGRLAIRTGLVLRRVGAYRFNATETGPRTNHFLAGTSFSIYAFDVPLDVRYQYDEVDGVEPYIFFGLQLSILRAEQDFDEALNDAVVSAHVGLGAEFEFPAAFGLIVAPEVMYTFGITAAVKDAFTYRFRQIRTHGPSFSGFSGRVNVYYPF